MIKCYLNAGQLNLTKGKVSKTWHCPARGWHVPITGDEQADPGWSINMGSKASCLPPVCPDAQQQRKGSQQSSTEEIYTLWFIGCFSDLFRLLNPQMPINICQDVEFHRTQFEKYSCGRFG